MPQYVFNIAGQPHVFEGPDPATTERFARQWAATAGRPGYADGQRQAGPVTGYGTTMARAIPGLTELGAGYSAALRSGDDLLHGRPADFGARWNQARGEQQGVVDQFRADHPIAANTAGALGGFAPVAATLGVGAPAGAVAAPAAAAPSLASRMAAAGARNALTGAAVAGTYGLAEPGDLRQRAASAVAAMPGGALLGMAIPPSMEGIGAAGRAAMSAKVATKLAALPESVVAAPDDAYAATRRLHDEAVAKLPVDIQHHFLLNAKDILNDPIFDDPDFQGYTGDQVADLSSTLSELARHYRPQGENGQALAGEVDRLNGDFTSMAARTQPKFARAMGAGAAGGGAGVWDLTQHLPMTDQTVASMNGDADANFEALRQRPGPADTGGRPLLVAPDDAPSTYAEAPPAAGVGHNSQAMLNDARDQMGDLLDHYRDSDPADQRTMRMIVRSFQPTDPNAPLPQGVVDLSQQRSLRAAPPAAPNAFNGQPPASPPPKSISSLSPRYLGPSAPPGMWGANAASG